MYLKLKYLFIFLCFLVFLSKAQGTPKDLYQLLVRVEQTSTHPVKEWKIPLIVKKDIAFFRYLTKKKGKKIRKRRTLVSVARQNLCRCFVEERETNRFRSIHCKLRL